MSGKFKEEPWQHHDIVRLLMRHDKLKESNEILKDDTAGTANWGEMGTYKTSTGLWFIERKLAEAGRLTPKAKPASVLIITNKSGKGTFFEAVPEIYKGWTFLNIETNSINVFMNGHWMKIPGLKFCPKEFGMNTVCITHYNVFSYANKGQFVTDDEDRPIKDENGKFVLKEWRQADYIADHLWDFVWTDEFHRMKDKDSRWTVNIKKIKTSVGRHGSTGTGFINRPSEIWSLLNWLNKKQYPSFWDFYEKYCEVDNADGYARVVGVKPGKRDEFRELVREVGVRRTLDNTHPDIEKAVFSPITVELNPTQRRMYDQIKMELATLDANGVELYSANVLSLLQRLRQICVGTPEIISDEYDPLLDRRVQKIKLTEPSSKLDAVMEILEGLQWDDERKEPLVVFSCFRDPLELLKTRLNKHNEFIASSGLDDSLLYKYIHLQQEDNDTVRYEKWHEEFPKLEHRIFMSTLQLGGESINLTPSHHLVFLDRSWSPKDNNQGIGRIRRPGQTSVPVVININAIKTTDQYIERVNEIKHGWFKQIFGPEQG